VRSLRVSPLRQATTARAETSYVDGVALNTSTPGAPTSGEGRAINVYSAGYRTAVFSAADAFVLPLCLSASQVKMLHAYATGIGA
jgi:hypothetical protein